MKQKTKLFSALGTLNSITIYETAGAASTHAANDKTDRALRTCMEMILDFHAKWSVFSEDSEVSRINKNAGSCPVEVMPDTISIIEQACLYEKQTGGAYDPAVGALYSIWKRALETKTVPSEAEIASVIPHRHLFRKHFNNSFHHEIEYDRRHSLVFLKKQGMSLDLGGIAKGYAAERTKERLMQYHVTDALINLGGTVTVIGRTRLVGIKNPFSSEESLIGHIPLSNCSMVTSGVYEQCFIEKGRRYHHIIDPRTGYPAKSSLVSVTLIGDDAAMLDAFATGVLVMGIEAGLPFLQRNKIDAVMLTEDGTVYTTPGIAGAFTLSKNDKAS